MTSASTLDKPKASPPSLLAQVRRLIFRITGLSFLGRHIVSLNSLEKYEDKFQQTLIRYVIFFGSIFGLLSFYQAYESVAFFAERGGGHWEIFLMPVGVVFTTAFLLVLLFGRRYLELSVFFVLLASHVNNIGTIAFAGHWSNLTWITVAITLMLQQFMLRGDSFRWLRWGLFFLIYVEFVSIAYVQEVNLGIRPLLAGQAAEAFISMAFFIFYFLLLEFGFATDNNLVRQLINSLRNTLDRLQSANIQLEEQKDAFLSIFEAVEKLQIYIEAYLRDMEHEIGNSLNPVMGLIDMISVNDEEGMSLEEQKPDLDRLMDIGAPRLQFAHQYVADGRIHLSSAIRYVTDAATVALKTREVEQDLNEAIKEMENRASAIGRSFYAEVAPFKSKDLLGRLNTIVKGRISRDVQLDVHLEIDSALDNTKTYPLAIRTIVTNLLVNAIKYTRPTPKDPHKNIWVKTFIDKKQFILVVKDEGSGIPEDVLPNLFDFGTRAAQDRKKEYGGGIGMWLVNEIATMTDAVIDVQSSPKGTTITVAFPIFS